jgi:hypothetical protein
MSAPALYDRYGWQSDLDTFSKSVPRVIRGRLNDFIPDASKEQILAWDRSIPWLQSECRELTARDSTACEYTAILEYELPRDFRRPDVLVLQNGCVAVLELKGYPRASQAAIDQVLGYARDLAAYHAACAGCPVTPVLLIRTSSRTQVLQDGVYVVAPEVLDSVLEELSNKDEPQIEVDAFLALDAYAPLPSIVQAARELFNKRPLPLIKRARAATDPALQYIKAVAHEAARTQTRHLVLLSGIPGSGKTLVGLQLVHAGWVDDLAVDRGSGKPTAPAVYLSGNGPLVEVLQHALKDGGGGGKTFVQPIKNYVATFSRPGAPAPPEHLIVFDEAQRAHDAERVAQVHRREVEKSEPQHLLEFCGRIPEWCVLVALIGDGQAIHIGEEGGARLWADAVSSLPGAGQWVIHGRPSFATDFTDLKSSSRWENVLNLDTEIRFHLTPKVHEFVGGLLDCAPATQLMAVASELHANAHRFLLTRDLKAACGYLRERYTNASEARFGLLASSKDKWLPQFGVDNSFQTTKRLRVGPWYNASPSDQQSCCQLDSVATEFASQGLELDCALLAWGSDLLWVDGQWSISQARGTRGSLKDPMALRKNVYRVLLTRGRDGTVVFVPADNRFDPTFEQLREAGMREFS